MEALLEREGKVESWNDGRLDELSGRMDNGFAKVDREMREGFARVDQEMNRRFDEMDQKVGHGFAEVGRNFDKVGREFDRLSDRIYKFLYGMAFVGFTLAINVLTNKISV